jgi:hypothetical protein
MFELARSSKKRHVVTRNFLGRGKKTLEAIKMLWHAQAYGDCWSLHRTLIDRLFHLHVLGRDQSFEVFDDWSFIQQYEARNSVLSDPEMRPKLDLSFWKPRTEDKARYARLKLSGVSWSRPKAEDAAKSFGYPFFYKYGYDFASTHVHPMANDGEAEFKRATGLGVPADFETQVILHNSILAYIVLLQEALIAAQLGWNNHILNFLKAAHRALSGRLDEYKIAFVKFAAIGPSGPWSNLAE